MADNDYKPGKLAEPWSFDDIASAHRSLIDAGIMPPEPAAVGGSDAKCEVCGAYYPHHLTRNCEGEHVAPVK